MLLVVLTGGLREKIQEYTRKVMCMIVRVSKLISNSIQEKISTFGIEIVHEMLEHIHWCAMGDGLVGISSFSVQLRDRSDANMNDKRVDKRHVVRCSIEVAVSFQRVKFPWQVKQK